jgi:hypothetical protein
VPVRTSTSRKPGAASPIRTARRRTLPTVHLHDRLSAKCSTGNHTDADARAGAAHCASRGEADTQATVCICWHGLSIDAWPCSPACGMQQRVRATALGEGNAKRRRLRAAGVAPALLSYRSRYLTCGRNGHRDGGFGIWPGRSIRLSPITCARARLPHHLHLLPRQPALLVEGHIRFCAVQDDLVATVCSRCVHQRRD